MHGMPLVWYENRESIAFYNRTLQRARDQSHKLCLFGIGKWALRKKKAADFFKKLVDKLPRAIRNLQKNFLSRSSFGLEATSEVLDDPSLFHPTLCYAAPYHRQTDRHTSCRNMPKYIMLSRISAELGKTGDWQYFRQYRNTMNKPQ